MDVMPIEGNFFLNQSIYCLHFLGWGQDSSKERGHTEIGEHRERGDIPVIAHLLGIQKGLHLIPLKGGRWGVGNQITCRANEREKISIDFKSFHQVCGGKHIASNSSCRGREDTLAKSLEQERTWKGKVLWEQSDSKLAERELQG